MNTSKNRYYRRSRIAEPKFRRLIKAFAMDLTATDAAELTGLSVRAANTRTTVNDGGTLQLNGPGITTAEHFRLTGKGSTGSNGALLVSQGDHTFTERIGLLADSTVNVSTNASATFGGANGQFFNARVLTKTGDGTAVFDRTSNIAGLVVADGVAAGFGGINGSVTVQNGAEFRQGDTANAAAVGTFHTDDPTLALGSTLLIDLNPDAASGEVVNVTGLLTLAGSLEINLLSDPFSADAFVIIDNDGSDAVAGQFGNGPTVAGLFAGQTYDFLILYTAGDDNDVALQLVPELTSALLLLLGVAGCGARRRPKQS